MTTLSEVGICNKALTQVGAKTITSFLDNTTESNLCSLHYASVRDAVNEAYNWAFSRARFGPMTPDATQPAFGFGQRYLLPPDLFMLRWAGTDPNGRRQLRRYTVEGRYLLCDEGSGVLIKYTKRVTDTSQFSSLFTEALVARLGAELAVPLAESRDLSKQMFQLYTAKVDEAASVDGQQGLNERVDAVRHQRARYSHGVAADEGFYSWG